MDQPLPPEADALLAMLAQDVVDALKGAAPLTLDVVLAAMGDPQLRAAVELMRARGELDAPASHKGAATENLRAFIESKQSPPAKGSTAWDLRLKKGGST